jgi:Nucleotidyltransferase domain
VYGRPMSLDPNVRATVDVYLDSTAGLIDGLYLYGSVALGDFRPPHSDIDFLAIVDGPLDAAALDWVHRSLPGPVFDGIYLTTDQLAAGPIDLAPTRFARDRRLHQPGRFEQNPPLTHETPRL